MAFMKDSLMLTLETKVTVPTDVLFRDLSGEAVLLNLADGKYYGLDGVGTRIWELLSESGRLDQTYQTLLQEFDVSPEQLQKDLLQLVEELVSRGLLNVKRET
jgi:hypothetical protein